MMRANPYGGPSLSDIRPVHWMIVLGILAVTAAFELLTGRNAICT